jgi:hypothetical protein
MYTLFKAGLLFCAFATWCVPRLPVRKTSLQEVPPRQATDAITIPDGTRLELRFAQPIRGPVSAFPWIEDVAVAKPGDKVRLVAAQNLCLDGRVVIARGAIGQATVTLSYCPVDSPKCHPKFSPPKYPSVDTGLFIQLDWIETVTRERIGLQIFNKGKPKAFHLMVLSANSGHFAKPDTVRHDLITAMTLGMSSPREEMKKKDWLPTGTRMVAFIQGPVSLDRADVEDAQAQFLASDSLVMRSGSGRGLSLLDVRMAAIDAQLRAGALIAGSRCHGEDQY